MRAYKLKRTPQEEAQRAAVELTDESLMTFGKHKDKPLKDVPAAYLLWAWDNFLHKKLNDPLHKYVKNAIRALQEECPDYIVENWPRE